MLTRIITGKKVYTLKNSAAVNETINVAGYRSARVVARVTSLTSGSQTVTFTNERGENIPLYGPYIAENLRFSQYFTESGTMNGDWEIDLDGVSELTIAKTDNNYIVGSLYIYFSNDPCDKNGIYPDAAIIRSLSSAQEYEFAVKDNYVKVDCKFLSTPSNSYTVRIYGMAEGSEEWSLLSPWSYTNGVRYSAGYYQGRTDFDFWLYAVGYTKIKVSVTGAYQQTTPMLVYVSQTATLARTIRINALSVVIPSGDYLRGKMKYALVEFRGATCTEKAMSFSMYYSGAKAPSLRNRYGEKMILNQITEISKLDNAGVIFNAAAEKITGKVIFVWDELVSLSSALVNASNQRTLKETPSAPVFNGEVYVTISDEEHLAFENAPAADFACEDYSIYHHDEVGGQIVDALGEDVLVKTEDTSYRLYRNGFAGWYYEIAIDDTHIPSLLSGEEVKFEKLVYTSGNMVGKTPTRVCLFTTKNRVLYDFVNGFYDYFREAPVYNLKKRFYPVNDKTKVSSVAKYLPIFPDYDYDQFSGRVGDGNAKDVFGLALPQRGSSIGSLLEDFHADRVGFGKLVYSNFVNSKAYGCIYGNYNLANGDPILLASPNGAEWYVVESFASVEDYQRDQLTTLKVDLSPIITAAGGYTAGSLKVTRRKYNVPSSTDKEPEHPFAIGASAVVQSITVVDNETVLTFVDETPLIGDAAELTRLTNLAPVVFFENINANSEYDYICNSCDQDGNGNTGVFFRMQRIGENQYKLWGNVGDPFEGRNICRHIHGVSEYQNGFIVSTGENYRTSYGGSEMTLFEGGFVFLVKTTRTNAVYPYAYNRTNALSSYFRSIYRLTSSENGVNRTCGAYLMSDIDNTLLYTSDDLYGPAVVIPIEGRENGFSRTKHGIYKIPVKDIDDLSKADCVAEVKEAGFGIVEHRGRFFVCTSCGEAIFSTDSGKTWKYQSISRLFPGAPNLPYTDVKGILNDGSIFYLNDEFKF